MSSARRLVLLGAGLVVVWYVCIVVFWAIRPFSDAVPVGVDYTLKPAAFVSVSVPCNGLFDSLARDNSPLPTLKPQPPKSPKLGYQREACGIVQHQARIVFGLATALLIAALVGCGWLALWWRRASSAPQVAAVQNLVESSAG